VRLLAFNQTFADRKDIVFRYKPLGPAIATVVLTSLLVSDIYGAVQVRDNGLRFFLIVWGLILLLVVWMAQRAWRAALYPTNWLMRIRDNRVLIKFRNFQNWELSDADLQIIELDRQEIVYVRRVVRKIECTSMGGSDTGTRTQNQLEMSLQNVQVAMIDAALQAERSKRVAQGSCTTVLNYPVELEDNLLRIDWSSISPGLKHALAELGKWVPVKEEAKTVNNFAPTALKTLSEDEQRKRIKELAAKDRIAAIRTARELYGCSLAEAKQIVES
jgi:hypothetical protein